MGVSTDQINRCIEVLKSFGAKRIILFGGALDAPESARDLDLAVEGLAGRTFFSAGALAERELHVALDLIPLDPPTSLSRYIERTGKILYDERGTS